MDASTENLKDRLIELSAVAGQQLPGGSLYVVGMPIGNAADITVRALWVLSHADAIAAEDTRVTRPLLARYGIATPLIAAHQHNERKAAQQILQRLARDERIALVTDAGTPAVSDPGALIVRAVLDAGGRVVPIAGPSSVMAAVSAAGLEAGPWLFAGFLPPRAREREQALRQLVSDPKPFVLFEAPHRIAALLQLLTKVAQPQRRVVLARELSKKFETISAYRVDQLIDVPVEERGEYVIVVDAAEQSHDIEPSLVRWLTALLGEMPPARAAAIAAKASGHPRQALYALALQLKLD